MSNTTTEIVEVEEIYISKEYISKGAFINAVRRNMASLLHEYPEDVLTGCYNSNESIEEVLKYKDSYYYESRELNIDVNMHSHIYLCLKYY